MKTFSTAEIAKILDVHPTWIRAQARESLVSPERDPRGHFRYSFQDLVLLRTARSLRIPGVSARRISSTLQTLSDSLPPGRGLSSLQIVSDGQTILAGADNTLWEPETGQTAFHFSVPGASNRDAEARNEITSLPQQETTAAAWFHRALDLEADHSPAAAESAYRRACSLDSSHINARINLGRIRHRANDLVDAEIWYRDALRINPQHPIALFNLGVAMEDGGSVESALECYKLAVDADPEIAEAHYNLARLYARHSEESAAVKHYSKYRALVRSQDS